MSNSTLRISKIICPSCEGTGECDLFAGPWGHVKCQWCKGARRLLVAEGIRYADQLYSLAIGGYICGDHDLEDADRMKAKAEAVCALAQQVPPWQKAA